MLLKILLCTVLALLGTTSLQAQTEYLLESRSFPALPGDTLVVQNDYGRVRVQGFPGRREVRLSMRKMARTLQGLSNVEVLAQKSGSRIFVSAFFYNYESEAAYLVIEAPDYLNVTVWGANPAVEVFDLNGMVRATTITGLITAYNLTSQVSLLTESGDIVYRCTRQPVGDARLETVQGNIRAYLSRSLNFRGWTRAGRRLSWNREVEFTQGHLERQMGVGGPLLLASSLHGDVDLILEGAPGKTEQADLNPAPPSLSQSPPTPLSSPQTSPSAGGQAPAPPGPPDNTLEDESPARVPSRGGPPLLVDGASEPTPAPTSSSPAAAVSGSAARGDFSLRVDVDWIYLNVSVRDRLTNRSIPNLRREDFLVYEDDVLQQVEKFESTEAPFHLLLLLDISGSTRGYMDLIKEASINFTRQIKGNDRIAVAAFNSRTRLVQDFTSDRQEVAEAIHRIRSGGGTAFYDALYTSVREYLERAEGRKAVVVFTDGVDNQLTGDYRNGSEITFPELYREIEEVDAIIYTIFLDTLEDVAPGASSSGGSMVDILIDIIRKGRNPNPSRSSRDQVRAYQVAREQLQRIADQTGGRMYAPRHIRDLGRVYSEIADDLRIQYTLAYSSSNPKRDGSWRKISVRLANRPNLVARTRKGYYAPNGP